ANHAHMAGIVIGITPILRQVERVAWKCVTSLSRVERINAVVECGGVGIGTLQLQSVAQAMGELGLQPMVNGVEYSLLIGWLQQGVVRYRIKRQSSKPQPLVQIATLDVSRSAAARAAKKLESVLVGEAVIGIAAELHQLLHQGWNWRVSIAVAPNVNSQGANIGQIECVAT